jgi:hypothetical protein
METSINGAEMLAYVVPAVHVEGETRTYYWLVVCILRDGDAEEGDVIFTKRPIAVERDGEPDLIGHFLRMTNGFEPENAEWTRHQVSDAPDDSCELDDISMCIGKRWSWPHGAFRSKQQYREVMQWWACPKDSAAYLEGKARAKAEGEALLASYPPEAEPELEDAAPLAAQADAAGREGPLPSWIKTGPAGAAS